MIEFLKRLIPFITFVTVVAACSSNQKLFVDYSNSHIAYSGRIDTSQFKGAELYWSGTSIKLNFEGESISALLEDEKGDKPGNTLHRTFSIAEDNDGNMWFGTVYSGIWKFDGTSFENFTEKEGVTSQNIWTIYKTKKGELLFAGEKPGAVYTFNGESFDRAF